MCGLYLQNEHQQQLRYCHTLQQGSAHVWGGVGRAWTGVAEDSHLTHFTPTPHLTSPPTYLPPSPSTHKPCPHLSPSSPTSHALTWLPLTSTLTFHPPKSHPHLYPHLPSTQLLPSPLPSPSIHPNPTLTSTLTFHPPNSHPLTGLALCILSDLGEGLECSIVAVTCLLADSHLLQGVQSCLQHLEEGRRKKCRLTGQVAWLHTLLSTPATV